MAHSIELWLLAQLNKMGASLFAAVLSFCLGRLWLDILKPRIENIFYKGLYLHTSYTGEFLQTGSTRVMRDHIELQQKADRVWGTMTVPDGLYGSYKFEATLKDGILRGTFESVGKASNSRGSFLLIKQAGSSELKGWSIEPIEGKVIQYEYTWRPRTSL